MKNKNLANQFVLAVFSLMSIWTLGYVFSRGFTHGKAVQEKKDA